jgi:acyl-coenzyme A thioesterase PaaI-like protein
MQEHLQLARKGFEKDNYVKSFGIVLDELTEDTIQMHMLLREDMLNWFNLPHGGAIYSLADAAFSVLGNNNNNLARRNPFNFKTYGCLFIQSLYEKGEDAHINCHHEKRVLPNGQANRSKY